MFARNAGGGNQRIEEFEAEMGDACSEKTNLEHHMLSETESKPASSCSTLSLLLTDTFFVAH
jgi:hypothetical protein